MTFLRVCVGIIGVAFIASVLTSAIETVVLPRHGFTRINRVVFALWHRLFVDRAWSRRDKIQSLFAPVALTSLPLVWVIAVIWGFALLFWALDIGSFKTAITVSGSSVTTLGFAKPNRQDLIWLSFIEAAIGLGLVALMISYLPTIYAGYNQREKGVKLLVPLAGRPPSSVEFFRRLRHARAMGTSPLWSTVLSWLTDIEQSHTAFPALCYFPPQYGEQSWVEAVGLVLDAGALIQSVAHGDAEEGFGLAMMYGSNLLIRVGREVGLPLPEVGQTDTTKMDGSQSVSREDYERAVDALVDLQVVGVVDREKGWTDFKKVRSSYERALRGLAALTTLSADRRGAQLSAKVGRPRFMNRPIKVDWSIGRSPFALTAPRDDVSRNSPNRGQTEQRP